MADNQSVWSESVSSRAGRMRLPIEHFIGYSLVCHDFDQSFRCFREFEMFCGACRIQDLKDS